MLLDHARQRRPDQYAVRHGGDAISPEGPFRIDRLATLRSAGGSARLGGLPKPASSPLDPRAFLAKECGLN
jgi:hypothetical protein